VLVKQDRTKEALAKYDEALKEAHDALAKQKSRDAGSVVRCSALRK
jgi:hypothetical protein